MIVLAACGCKPRATSPPTNPGDDDAPLYSPDGRWLAFMQQTIPTFYADRARLMLLDRTGGATRSLSGDWDRSAGGLELAARLEGALRRDRRCGHQPRLALRSRERRPAARRSPRLRASAALAVATRGAKPAAVAIRQSFSEPPTLVRLDLGSGAATRSPTFNDAPLAAIRQGKVESVTYQGARNADIQMWVVYPPDFDPAKKYPVFMLLHGGPHNGIQDAVQWRWNAQVFANWGYVVTWHNFHGSSGFGQAFTDAINPDRITLPYEDTIKAADWLVAKPWVDRERMVAGGGSYGGFLAATLLGRPHPFKALIAHAGGLQQLHADRAPTTAPRRTASSSSGRSRRSVRSTRRTSSAGNFNTPTLVIHGQQDLRVPVNHGIELFNTLQKRGVPSKLLYFPDENHWVLKPQNSLFWYREVRLVARQVHGRPGGGARGRRAGGEALRRAAIGRGGGLPTRRPPPAQCARSPPAAHRGRAPPPRLSCPCLRHRCRRSRGCPCRHTPCGRAAPRGRCP